MNTEELNLRGGLVDYLKFALSFLVVIIHSIKPDFLSPILRCAVPLFFILSSYFFFSKYDLLIDIKEKRKCLYNYIRRIFKLYLFWLIILLPFTIDYRNWYEVNIWNIVRSFCFSSTFPASWYIMASIIGMLLIVLMDKFLNHKIIIIICLASYLFCCATSNYGNLIIPYWDNIYELYEYCFTVPYNSFPVSLIWIYLGMFMSRNRYTFKKNDFKNVCLFVGSLFLLYIEYYLIKKFNLSKTDDCYIFLLPTCYFFLMFIGRMKILAKPNLFLRKTSTIIYCTHIPLMHMLMHIFIVLNVTIKYWIVLLIILSGILVSFLITKLEPKIKFLRYSY